MIRNPFRRRPPAELPQVIADLIDDVARAYLTRPGHAMARLTDLGQASFQMEATDPEWSTAADVVAAAAELDAARWAVLALSPTVCRALRRGIATTESTPGGTR
jgi:hypothetical protein